MAIVLALVLAACGGNGDTIDSSGNDSTSTTRRETSEATIPATPDFPVWHGEDECGEVTVEAGPDGFEWLAASDDPWGFTNFAMALDDGFLIATAQCTTVVDLDGRLRWSRVSSDVRDGVQVGDIVITVMSDMGEAILSGYDSASGTVVWEDRSTTGVWTSLTVLGDVVVLTGTGTGRLVATIDATTGEVLDTWSGRAGMGNALPIRHEHDVLVALSDGDVGRILRVEPTGTIAEGHQIEPRYPVPVVIAEGTIVVQAEAVDDGTSDVEPPHRFLAGYDLEDGRQLWNLTIPGSHADRAIAVHTSVIVPTSDGLQVIDARTGEIQWVTELLHAQLPMVSGVGGDAVASAEADGTLRVLELTDGATRWELPMGGVTRLFDTEAGLFLATLEGDYLVLDSRDGTELWRAKGPVPTFRDTLPNRYEWVEVSGVYATLACPASPDPCERTDQRVVAFSTD